MRTAEIRRKTNETDIRLTLSLDGSGQAVIETGIGFFDHMLDAFTRHGYFDLKLRCDGDLEVDTHHTVEDCGIVLGAAIREALGSKEGIARYGNAVIPMDEALVLCAVDISGRAWCDACLSFPTERCGEFETEMVREFFVAVANAAGITLHLRQMGGCNSHHIAEAAFKSFARALSEAVRVDPRVAGVPSTKGSL